LLANGDTVVVLSEVTVGKEKAPDANVYTLRDGKIIRANIYTDTAMTERIWGRKKAWQGS
jgi:ketosteroid isomerase-like protein